METAALWVLLVTAYNMPLGEYPTQEQCLVALDTAVLAPDSGWYGWAMQCVEKGQVPKTEPVMPWLD